MLGRIIFRVIHPHDDSDVFIFGRSRNNDLFCSGNEMALGHLRIGKKARRFNDDLTAQLFPWKRSRSLSDGKAFNPLVVDDQGIVIG